MPDPNEDIGIIILDLDDPPPGECGCCSNGGGGGGGTIKIDFSDEGHWIIFQPVATTGGSITGSLGTMTCSWTWRICSGRLPFTAPGLPLDITGATSIEFDIVMNCDWAQVNFVGVGQITILASGHYSIPVPAFPPHIISEIRAGGHTMWSGDVPGSFTITNCVAVFP